MAVTRRAIRTPLTLAALLGATAIVSGARIPLDEEIYYPGEVSGGAKASAEPEDLAAVDALGALNPSPRAENASVWEHRPDDRAGGRNEVLAAVTRMLITSKDY